MLGASRRVIGKCFAALFLFLAGPAASQVVLKPHGGTAIPLRTKALRASVTVDGQFASTRLNLTFQNETAERIEADFIYTLPPDTLITSFAYWYGDEKVQAKIVEKEEAAAIYAHITTRMRDPALVEMIGRNTFRARIFPVLPNSDLKVEMTLAQALISNGSVCSYTFPLKTERGDTLDSVHVAVRIKPDASIERVTNGSGLPVSHGAAGYALQLSGTNFRPQRDLTVRITRPARPLLASLVTSRPNSDDGFFGLALTPDCNLSHPRVSISGVPTYQLLPSLPDSIRAHQSIVLFGRFRRPGEARVTLTGRASGGRIERTARILFGASQETCAVSLWAARRLEQLASDARNRQAVIALSKRFGLPSKFTSWLAVPRAEMERYEQEIAQAKVETIARRLTLEISKHRENGPEGRRLRRQLKMWCRKAGTTPEGALSEVLSAELEAVAQRLSRQIATSPRWTSEKRRLSARLDRLCRLTGQSRKDALRDALDSTISELARALGDRIASGSEHTAQSSRLRAELDRLCRIAGERPSDHIQNGLYNTVEQAARAIVTERHRAHPNERRLESDLQEFHRLERAIGRSQQTVLTNEEASWKYREIGRVRDLLDAEYRHDPDDARRAEQLKARFLALHDADSREMARVRVERLKVHAEQDRLGSEREWAVRSHSPDVAAIEAKLQALNKREEELRARMGDPLISIEAPAGARQVIAVMPGGEIKRLVFNAASGRWEARFDIPVYASEGEYEIRIVIVLADGSRRTQTVRYHVDLTAPTGVASARSVIGVGPAIRLEIHGSEDTARVKAILPWTIVELRPGSIAHSFFALVPVPGGQVSSARAVTYVLTDRAHNRTAVTVDLEQ